MVVPELDGLIQDVLDGVATPEQAARLEAELRQDPAARQRRQELASVFEALGRVTRLEAPPELRSQILRSLPPRAPGVRVTAATPARQRLRLAYVFAAGLAAGAIGAGAMTGFWQAPTAGGLAVDGTMMPWASGGGSAASGSARWQAGSTRVDGRSWRMGMSRLAGFRVQGDEAEIELTFDPRTFSPVALRLSPRAGHAILEPGRAMFRAIGGGETVVELRERADSRLPLQVTIRAGGRTATGALPSPRAPAPR